MKHKNSIVTRPLATAALLTVCLLLLPGLATGCSFSPGKYLSRNACEVLNCDELFFIEDVFPLSERPMGDGGAGGGMDMDMDEVEDDGGGHAH